MRAFAQIAIAWSLTDLEQSALLDLRPETRTALLENGAMDYLWPETLERVSYLLGIYHALHVIFPSRQQADEWPRRQNSGALFNGRSALLFMSSGRLDDLAAVRRHLEGQGISYP